MLARVGRFVGRVPDSGLPWPHGGHPERSHRATAQRLVPHRRLRRHGPAHGPAHPVQEDGQERGAGPDRARQAPRESIRRPAA